MLLFSRPTPIRLILELCRVRVFRDALMDFGVSQKKEAIIILFLITFFAHIISKSPRGNASPLQVRHHENEISVGDRLVFLQKPFR